MPPTRRGLLAVSPALPLVRLAAVPDPDEYLLSLLRDFRLATVEIHRRAAACVAAGERDAAAEAAWEAACAERDAIENRMLAVEATTWTGVVAKAEVSLAITRSMRQPGEEPDFDLKFAERVFLDLISLQAHSAN